MKHNSFVTLNLIFKNKLIVKITEMDHVFIHIFMG